MAQNVSIFALPIYWLVVMATRMYTPFHIKRNTSPSASTTNGSTNNPTSDPEAHPLASNANPHSSHLISSLQKSLSPSAYYRWERIQHAHRNGMENMAFFYAAVILGNFARLNALELNLCSWLFVGARIVYVFVYIGVETEKASYARSAAFGVGVFLCWWLLLRAGVFVLYGYHELH